jgi:hypothetical protein
MGLGFGHVMQKQIDESDRVRFRHATRVYAKLSPIEKPAAPFGCILEGTAILGVFFGF